MPKPSTSEAIRQDFLDFFREKGHEVVPSAALVPQRDPTLLFTNAGMNQFKDVLLGEGSRPYVRAVNSQKCLRVSGKHNDLEEVGHDTYHHTFFEMLGNWSFGDYFKKEATALAWELLTERWGLEPDRLYATVHEGDEEKGLDADTEAASFWKSETTIPPGHILFGSSKDNFWMMGDTGPCGPCSEVHVDLREEEEREKVSGRELVNRDHPEVIEIWNLVFIQYNAQQDGTLEPLADQHVDTGMGFERVVAVLQGRASTYDTDLFAPILQQVADLSPRKEVTGYDDLVLDAAEKERVRIAMRVVADHLRACCFAVADGVMPGNTGRGYVIRRILRRAVRYGYQTLRFREPFLHRMVGTLVDKMGDAFPELRERREHIERVLRAEEEGFLETLGTGIAFFERITPYVRELSSQGDGYEEIEHTVASSRQKVLTKLQGDKQTLDLLEKAYIDTEERTAAIEQFIDTGAHRMIPGEVAFLLHDTYGFPFDLTRLMAREEGLDVDTERYEELMQRQKDRARAASSIPAGVGSISGGGAISGVGSNWKIVCEGNHSEFVGYDQTTVTDTAIHAVRPVVSDDEEKHEVVLTRTPFYAESGGQVGDTGTLSVGGDTVTVLDTYKQGPYIMHRVDRLPDDVSAPVEARVDTDRREQVMRHHTATHLLHAVLRDVLGDHVEQKGSLVAPDRLRFDFSHYERVSPDELREIERRVNEAIRHDIRRQEKREVPYREAVEQGAIALFGEKYGDTVRVITFDPDFSKELCGGTHVGATGEIGLFRILSEGSIAAGVRRIEAVVGEHALEHVQEELEELQRIRELVRSTQRPLDQEIADLLEQRKTLEKEVDRLRQKQLASGLDALIERATEVDGITLVTGNMGHVDADALRELASTLRERLEGDAVSVLGAIDPEGEKAYVVATVSDSLVKNGVKAGDLVGALGKRIGGGGGGRPDLATAGGREPEKLDEALQSVPELLRGEE